MKVEHHLTRKADDRGRVALGAEFSGEDVELTISRSLDVEELPTMRAVHFFGPPKEVRARLYAGCDRDDADALFGIHWSTGPVWTESIYKNQENSSAIKDFNAMMNAAEGSLVSSYYGARKRNLDEPDKYHLNNHLVIGVCPPGARVRAIPYETESGDIDFVKTLPLINTVEVSRDEYPELFKDNVRGLSVYESGKKESLIREAYSQRNK